MISSKRALIFRITHISNIEWTLTNGLYAPNSDIKDPSFRSIGLHSLIAKRDRKAVQVEPFGTLSDYVPFYFTPLSIMAFNISTGHGEAAKLDRNELALIVSSIPRLEELGVKYIFTDRHAYLRTASFYNSIEDLPKVDFELIAQRDFKRDTDDPDKTDRYQAEALVYKHLPLAGILGVGLPSKESMERIVAIDQGLEHPIRLVVKPDWFF